MRHGILSREVNRLRKVGYAVVMARRDAALRTGEAKLSADEHPKYTVWASKGAMRAVVCASAYTDLLGRVRIALHSHTWRTK